jgi:outer membrane murein-binding lipoprotein Lpp
MMELQKKETGQVYWACRSCMNFAQSITSKVQEVNQKVEELRGQVQENTNGVAKANEEVKRVEKKVEKMQKKMEESDNRSEESMYEEMRAREAIKRNVILYGVQDLDSNATTDKERMEADITSCEKIFKAAKSGAKRKDIRFCRRIGEKGQEKRPLLVGMTSELVKTELLDSARELQHTAFKHISIGPDQTRKQRAAEKKLAETAERKNREELTEDDMAKNLRWQAVGRKGEKRIVKAPVRENPWGEGPSHRRGGGTRGGGRGGQRSWRRTNEEEMETEDGSQKRTRGGGGSSSESEEGEDREPPRNRARQ